MKKTDFLKLAKTAAKAAEDKKGRDIVVLNVRRLTPIADYFVLVTVDSPPQMNAVAGEIHKAFTEQNAPRPLHREGAPSSPWTVLDYGGLIIHIMTPDARSFYALERIWSDARKVEPSKNKSAKSAKK